MILQYVPYAVVVIIVVYAVWAGIGRIRYDIAYDRQQKALGNSPDDSVLVSAGLLSTVSLTSMAQGKIKNTEYLYNFLTDDSGRVIMLVTLDHSTGMHVLSIGKDSSFILPDSGALGRVTLEGDFPDYFRLYAGAGQEIEVRQVFPPDIMAKFVDFCRAYDFELLNDSVYVAQAAAAPQAGDTTPMVADVTDFLVKTKPVFDHLGQAA